MTKHIFIVAARSKNTFIKQIQMYFSVFGNTSQTGEIFEKSFIRTVLLIAHSPSVIVINWPEEFLWYRKNIFIKMALSMYYLTLLSILKVRGAQILWCVNNLEPHDLKGFDRYIWIAFSYFYLRIVDGWFTLSPSTRVLVTERFGNLKNKPSSWIWHPDYEIKNNFTKTDVTNVLKIGHVGLLRQYKGLIEFGKIFTEANIKDVSLFYAGSGSNEIVGRLHEFSSNSNRIYIKNKYLNSYEYEKYLNELDVFIVPYTRFLHSGALVHALNLGCAVLAPKHPFTLDLRDRFGTDRVFIYSEPLTPSKLRTILVEIVKKSSDLEKKVPSCEAENGQLISALLDQLSKR